MMRTIVVIIIIIIIAATIDIAVYRKIIKTSKIVEINVLQ